MKKFLININLVLIAFIIYFLQSNFFSWFTIAGIKPNLFVVYVLFIGLFGNKSLGTIYGGVIGLFLDLLMEEKIGAIINIGAETTTVSVYNKNILIKTSIIGMAGRDIDNDISYMYKIDLEVAKKIKEKFALAHKKYASSSEIYELPGHKNIEQLEVSTITMSRIEEILTLAKKELLELTNRQMEYIIITGGVSNMSHFELVAENIFGKDVIIGNVRLIGIRNNKYSSAVGNIVYFINKLKIKGKNYTMVSDTDMEILSSTKKSLINVSNESMLGKVFGYFFGE